MRNPGPSVLFGGGSLPFNHGSIGLSSNNMSRYLRKGLGSAFDIDLLSYQFMYASFAPSKVYKLTTLRKQTKNQWAREEPSFVLLTLAMLAASSVCWGIAYEVPFSNPLSFLWLVAQSWIHYLLGGLILATSCWLFANRVLRVASQALPYSAVHSEVDWLYTWDVHCNGYTWLFWTLHVAQLLLAPFVLGESRVCTVLGNVLVMIAWVGYWHIVHLGYATLPFLKRANLLFAPAMATTALLLLLTVLNINAARFFLGFYIE